MYDTYENEFSRFKNKRSSDFLQQDIDSFDPNKFWNPLLYVDNSVGDLKNDTWHKVVYDGIDTPMVQKRTFVSSDCLIFGVQIYEMRKVKGVFLENLELNDFPVDVQVISLIFFEKSHKILSTQDLSITVSTTRTVNEVYLTPDTSQLSAINTRKMKNKFQTEFCLFSLSRCIYRSTRMAFT